MGSYYTPVDVARFFWAEFFPQAGITDAASARAYLETHHFIEPSVGAGALFFALLERFALMGLTPETLSRISADLVDLNDRALGFVRSEVSSLEASWGVRFAKLNCVHGDFRQFRPSHADRPSVLFGNPPFVSNGPGTSKWKNLFADFLEIALRESKEGGAVQFVLPLSVAFSKDYRELRGMLRDHKRAIVLSSFDNIPDTLFKSGKPLHGNTNKANSQRCSILGVFPSGAHRVLSTRLHRWARAERASILGSPPKYMDVTSYGFDDQFPRPANERILDYLDVSNGGGRLGDMVARDGGHRLHVAGVARNYIGIRDVSGSGVHDLGFARRGDFYGALQILGSDLFLDYWLSVGDGFHLTKANLLNFPLHPVLVGVIRSRQRKAENVWRMRGKYEKTKLNAGRETKSFDFSKAFDSLYILNTGIIVAA